MVTILLQRFENREYRLAQQSILAGKRQKGDKYKEKQNTRYAEAVHSTYVLQKELQQGEAASISDGKLERHSFGEVDARLGLRALDIINEFHLVQKVVQKGGWGKLSQPTSFTKNARHRLLEAGAIVDKVCGLNAFEVTCTLPGSTSDAKKLLAENTGWIMNELTRVIRKEKCKYWFYVWELQKRGALHLHLLVADPVRGTELLAQKLQKRWWGLLESISARTERDAFSRKTGGTWRESPATWQSHIAPIQKSVAAYFSKYAGKGLSNSSKNNLKNRAYCPSRWWGCSTEIKAQIKATRQKYVVNCSRSASLEVHALLTQWLTLGHPLKKYSYEFQLGKTRNGTELGGGEVSIRYYSDAEFARMQTWEKFVWDEVLDIVRRHEGEPMSAQTWTDADMGCLTPLDADLEKYRQSHLAQARTPASFPLSQQSSISCQLSNARGTQAEPALALRAQLVQFLDGGNEGTALPAPLSVKPKYEQLSLVLPETSTSSWKPLNPLG